MAVRGCNKAPPPGPASTGPLFFFELSRNQRAVSYISWHFPALTVLLKKTNKHAVRRSALGFVIISVSVSWSVLQNDRWAGKLPSVGMLTFVVFYSPGELGESFRAMFSAYPPPSQHEVSHFYNSLCRLSPFKELLIWNRKFLKCPMRLATLLWACASLSVRRRCYSKLLLFT